MSFTPVDLVLADVEIEIVRAKTLHGATPFHSAHEGFAVLDEERDELWDEIKTNPKAYATAMDPFGTKAWRNRMRKEAIQLAAMAVRFVAEVCG